MDLKSLLRPGGDALKPFVYGLLYAFVGASGLLGPSPHQMARRPSGTQSAGQGG